jgi:hypothetical protein
MPMNDAAVSIIPHLFPKGTLPNWEPPSSLQMKSPKLNLAQTQIVNRSPVGLYDSYS